MQDSGRPCPVEKQGKGRKQFLPCPGTSNYTALHIADYKHKRQGMWKSWLKISNYNIPDLDLSRMTEEEDLPQVVIRDS